MNEYLIACSSCSKKYFRTIPNKIWSPLDDASFSTLGRIAKSPTFYFDDNDLLIFKHISKTHCASKH